MLRMGWMLLFSIALAMPAQASEEIFLRHALTGKAQDALATLVLRFNDEQKGKAKVALQDLRDIDELTRQRLPLLALLDADDSTEFFGTRPRFKPLYQVLAESREKPNAKQFFPLIADAVDDPIGRLQALPLGLSLPVLMWNKALYRKAGLDPEKAPKTWWEVQAHAGSLFDAGVKCPVTSSRFAWVHLENLSAQHGEPIAVREKDGVTKSVLNRLIDVKHIALLTSWYKSSYFQYFGPGSESDRQFISGKCAIFTGESSLYAEAKHSGMAVGVAELPYYDDVRGATPSKVLPDGAALWVLAGHKKAEYQIAARFASFMLRPQVQVEWVRATGYLPMTPAAVEALKRVGVAPTLLDAATRRLSERPTATGRVKHGDNLTRIREILNEEMASVWANTKPAKEALDSAMHRVNDSQAFPIALPQSGR
ncbi:MAG: extracellular solute-binding protein [Sterolibacterium sp.]|nr:extracellular solute-binding protein [Sterolibacterium sp.]